MVSEVLRIAVNGALDSLAEDATIEDVMERLYFLAKLERGKQQAEDGRVVSHEEVEREFLHRCV